MSAKVPVLGKARLGLFYLPLVRDGMRAVLSALDHWRAALEARRAAAEGALRQLHARRAARARRESASARLQVLGEPATAAARAAGVDKAVEAAWPALRRLLRDLTVWQAPAERLLEDLLAPTLAELRRQVPSRSLDEVLFEGRDAGRVAQDFDRAVRAAAVPLGLVPGTDRAALQPAHCVVLRVPRGSRLKAALAEHCQYDPGRIAESDAHDRIDVLQWQLGISIEDTELYRQGADAWASEREDPTAPPLATLSDALLAPPRRPAAGAARPSRREPRQRELVARQWLVRLPQPALGRLGLRESPLAMRLRAPPSGGRLPQERHACSVGLRRHKRAGAPRRKRRESRSPSQARTRVPHA